MTLISIVVPIYNAEKYIRETLDSILNQTYKNFEVLLVDDLSTDGTIKIIQEYMNKDNRIKLFFLKEKGGASIARNLAIKNAKGDFIAFLDSDDIWLPEKLEKQISFMKENNYDFTYTNYGFIDSNSNKLDKFNNSPETISRKSLERKNRIGCLTVMYNRLNIGLIQIPRIDKRNDYALWLKIMSRVDTGYLLPEILSLYRVDSNSLSRKDGKINLIKYHYQLHRKIQGYNILKALYLTFLNIILNLFN